ncbi:DNA-binding protein [Streptomyces sp. CB02959]|uniref:helix-turn-helix domain-containing protein n=1 Tax=Streptomyces sp. CB02959 TaxID=2020330 RepID=UPI000C279D99|nr:helix-turn-helix domain-containing protein [Streptomyces sp. CB02959]PJN38955.1 DNA-binding protein [Streptomyces sp. CB02959]
MSAPSLFTYDEAADALRVQKTWLQRHIKALPHTKIGREVLFTEEHLAEIVRAFHVAPVTGPLADTSAAPAASNPLATLRPLPARRSLRRTS